jgi:hypothetical protein
MPKSPAGGMKKPQHNGDIMSLRISIMGQLKSNSHHLTVKVAVVAAVVVVAGSAVESVVPAVQVAVARSVAATTAIGQTE